MCCDLALEFHTVTVVDNSLCSRISCCRFRCFFLFLPIRDHVELDSCAIHSAMFLPFASRFLVRHESKPFQRRQLYVFSSANTLGSHMRTFSSLSAEPQTTKHKDIHGCNVLERLLQFRLVIPICLVRDSLFLSHIMFGDLFC